MQYSEEVCQQMLASQLLCSCFWLSAVLFLLLWLLYMTIAYLWVLDPANGKLEMVPDTPRGDLMPLPPSGTSFVLTTVTQQSAIDAESLSKLKELDETYLIVGSVVEGEDVLMKLKELPYNKSNEDSLFFKAGKSSGDKRALVAERGFNRPFAKIVISDSGRV